MKTYIGTKMVQAEPAKRFFFKDGSVLVIQLEDKLAMDQVNLQETIAEETGYQVLYQDGYSSWSPKDVFEKAYLEMDVNPLLRTTKPSISQKMVDDFIIGRQVTTMGNKCTVVRAILRNGFEIVESSACVSVENYDEAMGAEICMRKIKDKVWFLLGFLLQTAVSGVDGSSVAIWDKGERKSMTLVGTPMAGEEACGEACEAAAEEDKPVLKRLFISQPMKGKTDEEILAVREKAVETAEAILGEKVEVIDSFFQGAPVDATPLWYLAKSLELLSTADVAYFAEDWEKFRGCRIENECAVGYGIDVIEDYKP